MVAWARPDARQKEQGPCGLCSPGTPTTGKNELLLKMPLRHVDYKLHRASQKEEEVSPPVLFAFVKSVPVCVGIRMCGVLGCVGLDACTQCMRRPERSRVLLYY